MSTTKTKIIISAIAILLFSAIIIFALKNKNKTITENSGIEKTAIEELKNNFPEISGEQIKFYRQIADNDEISKCLSREDEKDCIAAVAFIKNDKDMCYIHDHNGENEEYDEQALLKKCVNNILRKNASEEVAECKKLDGDDFFNCIKDLFKIYEKKDECANLLDEQARMICEDIFNYEDAFLQYDRALCAQVKTEKLNNYCLGTIIDKNQDTDGDGLTDLDEINKYKTHYLFKDTDGDGISDSEEVKSMNFAR